VFFLSDAGKIFSLDALLSIVNDLIFSILRDFKMTRSALIAALLALALTACGQKEEAAPADAPAAEAAAPADAAAAPAEAAPAEAAPAADAAAK
jgi:predicted small lipoprotein YifL